MKKLVPQSHPALHKKAKPVKEFDDRLKRLVLNMTTTMHRENGIGLAAPQIGKSLQIFVIDENLIREVEMAETTSRLKKTAQKFLKKRIRSIFINPEITSISSDGFFLEEGCLSIPGMFGSVPRAEKVTILAKDELGKSFTVTATGLHAHVLQHEIDHLQGILFVEKVKKGSLHKLPKHAKTSSG